MSIISYRDIRYFNVKEITARQSLFILLAALSSGFLTPTLYFIGIKYANVINAVLISTLQIPLTLFSGWVFFREKPKFNLLVGSLLTVIGVASIILLQNFENASIITYQKSSGMINKSLFSIVPFLGETCILFAVISSTFSTLIGFHAINILPIKIFNIFRMFVGTIIFFSIVLLMFGWSHFADLFSPFLWKWMLFYGVVIVALNIYFYCQAIKYAKLPEITISSSLVPLSSIFFSFFILGVLPGKAQLIGGSLILIGMMIGLIGKLKQSKETNILEKPAEFSGI